jgi:hypothetical protein
VGCATNFVGERVMRACQTTLDLTVDPHGFPDNPLRHSTATKKRYFQQRAAMQVRNDVDYAPITARMRALRDSRIMHLCASCPNTCFASQSHGN